MTLCVTQYWGNVVLLVLLSLLLFCLGGRGGGSPFDTRGALADTLTSYLKVSDEGTARWLEHHYTQ